jgi:putative acetyltransferase
MRIIPAESDEDVARAKALFLEYAASLDFKLCFQDFERELASLPGDYAAPAGRLLIALGEGDAVGCVALRPLEADVCEIKRLYVRPEARGRGTGRALADKIIGEARLIGYKRMRLDAIRTMTAAVRLYESLGFREIEPYRFNPISDAVYMELSLD